MTPKRRHAPAALCLLALAALAGCNETAGVIEASAPASPRPAARPGVSPGGASVAFISLEGAPPAIAARFSERAGAEARRREVSIADAAGAQYLVRGYLSTWPVESGTAFGYVWDVFDQSRRRVQRSQDAIVVRGQAPDPWSLATEPALASLAAKSADDLAAVLSNTPEAVAANASPPAAAAIAAQARTQPPAALPAGLRAYR